MVFLMGTGKDADVPADSSMKARLEIQNSVPHIGYTMNADGSRCLHSPENQIGGRTTLRNIIAADHCINGIFIPSHGLEQEGGDGSIESGVEGYFDTLAP